MRSPLVSIEWLKGNLGSKDLVLVDASLENAVTQTSPSVNLQIPGSISIDIGSALYDRTSDLPHMLPSESDFAHEASALGISNSSKIIVYDSKGIYSSPRLRWMFK